MIEINYKDWWEDLDTVVYDSEVIVYRFNKEGVDKFKKISNLDT